MGGKNKTGLNFPSAANKTVEKKEDLEMEQQTVGHFQLQHHCTRANYCLHADPAPQRANLMQNHGDPLNSHFQSVSL